METPRCQFTHFQSWQQVLTLGLSTEEAFLPFNNKEDFTVTRKDWAVFLSTDVEHDSAKMLQIYALRWSIEVYSKEAKQHLGSLQEQAYSFVPHIASIHLCAIRYLMLVDAKLITNEVSVGKVRSQKQFDSLSYASKLWSASRSLVAGTLQSMRDQLQCSVDVVMEKIEDQATRFLIQAL